MLVKDYQQILRNIRQYNQDLIINTYLQRLLHNHRVWYYIYDLDAFGPSKYIGNINMTGEEYYNSRDINFNDGGRTERALKPFFQTVYQEDPNYAYLKDKLVALLQKYGAKPNSLLRLNIPLHG